LGSVQAIDHRLRPEPASLGQIEVVLERWSRDYAMKMFGHAPALAGHLRDGEKYFDENFSALDLLRSSCGTSG
jgi:hypothetical protein